MNSRQCLRITLAVFFAATQVNARQSLEGLVDLEVPSLVQTYKTFHGVPELSLHEEKTSAYFARELRAIGYDVIEHVGQYTNAQRMAYGVVAVLKNGTGPTVLVRTELDALPVEERTGLPYASTVKTKNDAGEEVSVMHASGHDIHMTSLLGMAKVLSQLRAQWHGTLVLIGQPAEETVQGANAMLSDGLYSRFPKPDYALALHDASDLEAGKVGYVPGYSLSSSTSVDIAVHGLGGHGSKPEATKDPIVVAAQIVLALQTIVSRELSPFDPAVVTVGSIHGGSKSNITPDEVKLQLTVRAYKEEVRQHIIASIKRISENIALAAGIPATMTPTIRIIDGTDATYNDPNLTERVANAMQKTLGANNVVKLGPEMASEDFCHYGLEGRKIPICMFRLGAIDSAKVAESRKSGIPLPSLHSSMFAPVPEPTIRTGVIAMSSAVMELLAK